MDVREKSLTTGALALGVVSRVFCVCLFREGGAVLARGWFLLGAPMAVLLGLALALAERCATREKTHSDVNKCAAEMPAHGFARDVAVHFLCAAAGVWFLLEAAVSLWQLCAVCQREVLSAGALWCIFAAAILLLRPLQSGDLGRASRVLWWFMVVGLLLFAVGIGGQLRWQRLSAQAVELSTLRAQTALWPRLYPEYLAFLLFAVHKNQQSAVRERRGDANDKAEDGKSVNDEGPDDKVAGSKDTVRQQPEHAPRGRTKKAARDERKAVGCSSAKSVACAVLLPLAAWGVQAGFALCAELLFGASDGTGYRGLELARVWGAGMFSRCDGIFLLVWIATAFYRIALMLFCARTLWRRTGKEG